MKEIDIVFTEVFTLFLILINIYQLFFFLFAGTFKCEKYSASHAGSPMQQIVK